MFKITKETLYRALRTFIQTAAAYVIANITVVDFSGEENIWKNAMAGLIISAVAAGLAGVMNLQKGGAINGNS